MHARRSAKPRPDPIIEGRATLIERRSATPARSTPAPAPAPSLPADIRPINDNAAGLAPYRRPRPAAPDLVFQGSPRWSKRPAAPRRAEGRHHAAEVPAPRDEAARQKASVGVMVAVVASLAAWSTPELARPPLQPAAPAHSTHGAQSATTMPTGTVSGSGKGDRITFGK